MMDSYWVLWPSTESTIHNFIYPKWIAECYFTSRTSREKTKSNIVPLPSDHCHLLTNSLDLNHFNRRAAADNTPEPTTGNANTEKVVSRLPHMHLTTPNQYSNKNCIRPFTENGSPCNPHANIKYSISIPPVGNNTFEHNMNLVNQTAANENQTAAPNALKNLHDTNASLLRLERCRPPPQNIHQEYLETAWRKLEIKWKYTTQNKIQNNPKNKPGTHRTPIKTSHVLRMNWIWLLHNVRRIPKCTEATGPAHLQARTTHNRINNVVRRTPRHTESHM